MNQAIPATFQFSSPTDPRIETIWKTIVPEYEERVDNWLPGISFSQEYAVFVSMSYNGLINAGVSPTLKQHVLDGDRAEAWYEIRYNSNGGDSVSPGIANRCYVEAERLGLFHNPNAPTLQEAHDAAQMYTSHRGPLGIQFYESLYNPLTAATTKAEPGIEDIYHEMEPAIDYLKGEYGIASSFHIEEVQMATDTIKGLNGDGTNFDSSSNDQDLLIGDSTMNDLDGGKSNDALVGNGGDDILTGGEGNDSLLGGYGEDTYIFDDDFGDDIINESGDLGDGKGLIVINGDTFPINFQAEDDMPNQMWWIGTETDNKGSVFLNGGTLYVYKEDAEGVIKIDNFKNDGGFGFTLGGLPAKDPGHPDVPAPPSGNEPHFDPKADDINKHFKHPPASPLVIDYDRDGLIELTPLSDSSHAYFDLDADGFVEQTGWVQADDALAKLAANDNRQLEAELNFLNAA